MRIALAAAIILTASCAIPALAADDAPVAKTRHQFAAAISKVEKGMPAAEVLKLLGKPDDIRGESDPGGISTTRTKEIWRYGTSGHLTTATLGQVYIDNKDGAQYIFGQGTPHTPESFEEGELRRLLTALGQVPSYNSGYSYNPLPVIRAVNGLQPLGKERALDVIEEWLRVASSWHDNGYEGVFLVLRTLFDVPADPGHMPDMFVGAPVVRQQEDQTILPRFPIAIEGDIPLLVNSGYSLAGQAEQPQSHVTYFREHGKLRDKPLAPTAEPLAALERFLKSSRSPYLDKSRLFDEERGRQFLSEQVLRLLDSVYRVEPQEDGDLLPWGKAGAARRAEILRGATELKIRWEAAAGQYVFLDGTSLPPRIPPQYRRQTWKPQIPGREIEITFERDSPKRLDVWVSESYEIGNLHERLIVTVANARSPDRALVQFEIGGKSEEGRFSRVESSAGGTASTTTWKPASIAEGEEILFEVKLGEKKLLSPKYKP
jgi:hypothetical protein